MSDPKKELSSEQLAKIAGGKSSSTSAKSSSHSTMRPSSSSSLSGIKHTPPAPHKYSSSTSR